MQGRKQKFVMAFTMISQSKSHENKVELKLFEENELENLIVSEYNRPVGIYIMDPLQGFATAQKSIDGYSYVGVSGYTFTLKGYSFREDV